MVSTMVVVVVSIPGNFCAKRKKDPLISFIQWYDLFMLSHIVFRFWTIQYSIEDRRAVDILDSVCHHNRIFDEFLANGCAHNTDTESRLTQPRFTGSATCTRSPAKYAGAMVVRVCAFLSRSRGLKLVPSKWRYLVPPASK